MRTSAALVLVAIAPWSLTSGASAASLVLGGGQAQACYDAARRIDAPRSATAAQLQACTDALESEALSVNDRAGTLVNRGILQMSRQAYAAALADYAAALRLRPDNGVAHVNRGAALIGLGRAREAVEAIDRGLALNAAEPEKAYFNRAYAREQLGDIKGAYLDFTRAAELRPDWDLPRTELARFTVHRPEG
jgi:tetratricopeptide (TPR) repeat protein